MREPGTAEQQCEVAEHQTVRELTQQQNQQDAYAQREKAERPNSPLIHGRDRSALPLVAPLLVAMSVTLRNLSRATTEGPDVRRGSCWRVRRGTMRASLPVGATASRPSQA